MELLTEELKKKFEKYPLGSQDNVGGDAKVIAKFFTPTANATWLITEGSLEAPETEYEEYIMFGFANLGINEFAEMGYISLNELQEIRCPFGLGVERDIAYDNKDITLRDACMEEFGFVPDYLQTKTTVEVLQVKQGDDYRNLRFHAYEHTDKVAAENYDCVFQRKMTTGSLDTEDKISDLLNNLYDEFNFGEKPDGYEGHSMSVSDIIVFSSKEMQAAYFCDNFGWKKLPDTFLKEWQTQKNISLAEKLNDYMKDTDFYDYMDNMEIGETEEDVVNNLAENLNDKKFCDGVLSFLADRQAEISIDLAEILKTPIVVEQLQDIADGKERAIDNISDLMDNVYAHIEDLSSVPQENELINEPDITE